MTLTQIAQEGNRLRRYDASGDALTFPPAPFADAELIHAIRISDELQLETQQMRHCVVSYSNRIYDGQYAVYKVLTPQRLNLGLSLRHGHAALDQLKGVANQAPNAEAQAMV